MEIVNNGKGGLSIAINVARVSLKTSLPYSPFKSWKWPSLMIGRPSEFILFLVGICVIGILAYLGMKGTGAL